MRTSLHSVWGNLANESNYRTGGSKPASKDGKTCSHRMSLPNLSQPTFTSLISGGKVVCLTRPTTWLPAQSQSWQCLYAANGVFKNDTRSYINNYAHWLSYSRWHIGSKKNGYPECFPDYELGPCRGSQGKYWRLQNDKWAEREEIHKVKITTAFSLYLFIENLNILLSEFFSQPFYCHTICLKYITNPKHFNIGYYSVRAIVTVTINAVLPL